MEKGKIKIGDKRVININYWIYPVSGLAGYKIHCEFKKNKQIYQFAYHEFDEDKIKNGLSEEHIEIIRRMFIANFTDFYFKYVSF